ncbi:hypothetical protein [Pseudofrankia sp. BMG5.36]|uniref:hypothetical protein n=1 Tax=Pseudofrankia sp. BMG5.36 TaxID=1834512 RepID=UPI0008DB21EB|nr:hypothetical protein [Pseudofrankia sp. BMG5.36]OHV49710.1 hypothetical protein BCD48_12270 [Pseudofrankia sp. BMG5.36]
MRLDEHGRWVSDDGAYVWDESAQTWQPTSRAPGGAAASGAVNPAARPGGATGVTGAYGSADPGQRPATQADAGGYGGRPGAGQQAYNEPRTGSFPLFGAEERTGRDREATWSPVTGPYPQPGRTGGFAADSHPLDAGTEWRGGPAPARGGTPARGGSPADHEPGGPPSPGSVGGGVGSTGQSRAWPARDPLGTGPYDRPDPLATGTGRGYDRADPLTGPFGRADPLGTGSSTGSWSRDTSRGGPGRSGPGTGPGASRGGPGTGPSASRGGAALTGPLDSPGTEAMNRPTIPVVGRQGMTDPLPEDPARTGARGSSRLSDASSGGSGRFVAASPAKTGVGTGPRAASPPEGRTLDRGRARDLDRDAPGLLDDDDHDEDVDPADGPAWRGARDRLRGLTGGRLGSARDEDILDDEDDEDDDEVGQENRGGLAGKLKTGRGRTLVFGAAALVVVLVAVILLLKVTGGGDSSPKGDSGTSTTAGRKYDDSVRKTYLDTCVGGNNGMTNYCNCTLDKLEAGYSQDDFLRLNADVQSAAAQRVIKDIRQACEKLK